MKKLLFIGLLLSGTAFADCSITFKHTMDICTAEGQSPHCIKLLKDYLNCLEKTNLTAKPEVMQCTYLNDQYGVPTFERCEGKEVTCFRRHLTDSTTCKFKF